MPPKKGTGIGGAKAKAGEESETAEKLRVAIVNADKCKPKKCALECKKQCPVVRMGKMCVEVTKTSKITWISEDLCIGCAICVKVRRGTACGARAASWVFPAPHLCLPAVLSPPDSTLLTRAPPFNSSAAPTRPFRSSTCLRTWLVRFVETRYRAACPVHACFNAVSPRRPAVIHAPPQTTHRYGPNSFKLHRLPVPRPGQVLGLVGTNGIGKSTAMKILGGKLKPNLGDFEVRFPLRGVGVGKGGGCSSRAWSAAPRRGFARIPPDRSSAIPVDGVHACQGHSLPVRSQLLSGTTSSSSPSPHRSPPASPPSPPVPSPPRRLPLSGKARLAGRAGPLPRLRAAELFHENP